VKARADGGQTTSDMRVASHRDNSRTDLRDYTAFPDQDARKRDSVDTPLTQAAVGGYHDVKRLAALIPAFQTISLGRTVRTQQYDPRSRRAGDVDVGRPLIYGLSVKWAG